MSATTSTDSGVPIQNGLRDDAPPAVASLDMFGQPVKEVQWSKLAGKPKRKTIPRGYAALPGTGPHGETCGSCRHKVRVAAAGHYLKCALVRRAWTHGMATDIRARWPACQRWEGRV
jgi:hypothetical protein